MITARSFIVFTVLLAVPLRASAELVPYYRLSLERCFELAIRNNDEIRAAGHDIETVVAKKIEATRRYVPVVNYKHRIGPVPRDLDEPAESLGQGDISLFNSLKVETGAPITTFGRLNLAQMLADLGVDLKTLEKQKKEDEVLLNLYKLYQGVLLARQIKALIAEGLTAVRDKIVEMEGEETTDQMEILKLKVILYEAERRFQEAEVKDAIAIETMKVLMGLDAEANFDIKDRAPRLEPFRDRSFTQILEESRRYRPEFRQLAKGVEAKGLQIELEKKEYLPNLGWGAFAEIGAAPGIRGDEDQNDFTDPFNYKRAGVGLELSGKLDFRGTKSKVSAAHAEYLKTISQKRAAIKGLELDLKKSYLELKQHRFLLSRAEDDKRAARQMVVLTKSNLDIGLGEKKDYLDALQSYLLFQGRAYEALFYYNTAVATLKAKMGTLYAGPGRRRTLTDP